MTATTGWSCDDALTMRWDGNLNATNLVGNHTGTSNAWRRSATLIVAASDSKDKTHADYVCDGTADEVEINAAIAALPSGGGKILLMEGTFTCAASINLTLNNLNFEGMGRSTIITSGAITNLIYSTQTTKSTIRNMGLTGSATNIIYFANDISYSTIEFCEITGVNGLVFNGTYENHIKIFNNIFVCSTISISSKQLYGCVISYNLFNDYGIIASQRVTISNISNNTFLGLHGTAIDFTYPDKSVISNNLFANPQPLSESYCIKLAKASTCLIMGNAAWQLVAGDVASLYLTTSGGTGGSENIINGNIFKCYSNVSTYSAILEKTTNSILFGNRFKLISLDANCTGNIIGGCVYEGLTNSGTGNVLIGNIDL